LPDAHPVERPVDEDEGHGEKRGRKCPCQRAAGGRREFHGKFHGEEAKECCELDDRIEGDGRGVFEWIADRIADDGGVMQRGPFLFQLDFYDFLGVVPGASGIGHEDGLIKAGNGDGQEIADEKEWIEEGKSQCGKKTRR